MCQKRVIVNNTEISGWKIQSYCRRGPRRKGKQIFLPVIHSRTNVDKDIVTP